jgi:hypothetical protein
MPERETAMCAVLRKFAHFSIRLPGEGKKKAKKRKKASAKVATAPESLISLPEKEAKKNFSADIIEIILQLKSQAETHT